MYLTSHRYQKYGWNLGERKCWVQAGRNWTEPACPWLGFLEGGGLVRQKSTNQRERSLLQGGAAAEGVQLSSQQLPEITVEQTRGQRNWRSPSLGDFACW